MIQYPEVYPEPCQTSKIEFFAKIANDFYMINPTQITNIEIVALIAVLVFKLMIRKVLFIRRKDNRNC